MAARATTERFVVTHPFVYFVLDTDTHVALMAGKIVDPLNSRIYWWEPSQTDKNCHILQNLNFYMESQVKVWAFK
jgi:hypothetical protein